LLGTSTLLGDGVEGNTNADRQAQSCAQDGLGLGPMASRGQRRYLASAWA